MYRKVSIAMYIIFGLFAIGLLTRLARNLTLLVPLLVFGIIFLLYKFPPSTWGNRNNSSRGSAAQRRSKDKSRRGSFRVIKGNKPDDDDNGPPHVH